MTVKRKRKDRCTHLNADLSMCQSRRLYSSSICCKKHFADIDGSTKASKVQMKRLGRLRKTIKQIKDEVGFSLET